MDPNKQEQVDEQRRSRSDDVQERGLASSPRFAFLVPEQIIRQYNLVMAQADLWLYDLTTVYRPDLSDEIAENVKLLRNALNAAAIQQSHIVYHIQTIEDARRKHDYIKAYGKQAWEDKLGNETY